MQDGVVNTWIILQLTDINPCPKCKKRNGWVWHWGKNDGKGTGYGECKNCGAKF